jgi:S1-C subfamily serine protease
MVTQGIASLTNKIKTGLFLSDALYNPGISGSPVFAIRDGIPNFELVGMASAAAAQESNILIPDKEIVDKTIIKTPYTGDIFVDNNKLISYGITYSVSIDEISTFIQLNKEGLIANGFEINDFFK